MIRSPQRASALLAAACAVLALGAPPAAADVFGPDESIAQAGGPLQPQTTYTGAFGSPDDIDYVSFDVTQPGQTLHFDVVNTLRGCSSPDNDNCPMWATLMDGNDQQVGGARSSAGTGEVDYASSDGIDWTFATSGRYYVLLESSGDMPTFQLAFHVVPPKPPPPKPPSKLVRALTISGHQSGGVVRGAIDLSAPLARLDVQPTARVGSHHRLTVLGELIQRRTIAGTERFRVPVRVRGWLSRKKALAITVSVRAIGTDGRSQLVLTHVMLRR
jgi:hypothetical protein